MTNSEEQKIAMYGVQWPDGSITNASESTDEAMRDFTDLYGLYLGPHRKLVELEVRIVGEVE